MCDVNIARPEEKEAILLGWRLNNPDAPPGSGPTPEESDILLSEIRIREAAIEARALGPLRRMTRHPGSYSGNGRHLRLLFYFLFGICALAGLIALASRLFQR